MKTPPLIIGGTGGSGTRMFARVVRLAGYYMGAKVNISEDAMCFPVFYDRWINAFSQGDLSVDQQQKMIAEFQACITDHLSTIPTTSMNWGYKEPRSIYLLPFLNSQFPEMKFIHVVRSGLDMAFSGNQNQLRKHGDANIDAEYTDKPLAVKSIALWNKVNMQMSDWAEHHMQGRYLALRYEDLCCHRDDVGQQIYDFIGCNNAEVLHHSVADIIRSPGSDRWKAQDPALLTELFEVAKLGLQRFNYYDAASLQALQENAKLKRLPFWKRKLSSKV